MSYWGASNFREFESDPKAVKGRSKTIWVNGKDTSRESNHVAFRSYWKLQGAEQEALAILSEYANISNWWGGTFLETPVYSEPDGGLVGLKGGIRSRGFLPYQFHWQAEVISADDDAVVLSAVGDFEGTGTFRRPNADEDAALCFDWDVRILQPLLRSLCPWACRVYLWNHAYAMADGARSLQAEMERRRT